MTTELRAYNAQGEQLFFVPDTDARQFLEFDKVGDAFDRMEATRTAFRWIADGSRFVRNRVATFRMNDEHWNRDDVAQHAQVRAARRAQLAPQEAPAPIELTALSYERRTGGDGTGEFDNTTVYAVWVRKEIESAQQRGIKVTDNGYGMIKIHDDARPVRFFALPDTPAAAPQDATQDAPAAPQAPTVADGHREDAAHWTAEAAQGPQAPAAVVVKVDMVTPTKGLVSIAGTDHTATVLHDAHRPGGTKGEGWSIEDADTGRVTATRQRGMNAAIHAFTTAVGILAPLDIRTDHEYRRTGQRDT